MQYIAGNPRRNPDEISEKIMKTVDDEELRDIEHSLEMDKYLSLTPEAKAKMDLVIMED